jgi:predicted alpha/beta superfamily hydrolase
MKLIRFCKIVVLSTWVITASCQQSTPDWPQVSYGSLERWENFYSDYVDARHIDIWISPYCKDNAGCRVLYMHDGQMLYDSTTTWNKQEWRVDEAFESLHSEGFATDFILVGIWNNGELRPAEFFPQQALATMDCEKKEMMYSRFPDGKPLADNYLQFVVKELMPAIHMMYKTRTDRASQYIGGSSMGGLISMYALLEYPQHFSTAICLSTHWPGIFEANDCIPGALLSYLETNISKLDRSHRLYFDYGTATLDSIYEPYQLQADKIVSAKSFETMTVKYPGADHSEKAWAQRLPEVFRWCLRGE